LPEGSIYEPAKEEIEAEIRGPDTTKFPSVNDVAEAVVGNALRSKPKAHSKYIGYNDECEC